MAALAVVLAVVGVVLIVAGIVVYANGAGVEPTGRTEGQRVTRGFAQVSYRDMFALMPRSVKVITDADAGRRDRLRGAGAFTLAVGIVVVCLAVIAAIGALL
ncbi:MAG: hypothetical protein ACM4D3_07070 [Candidatus Sericytochromatia bacterium]